MAINHLKVIFPLLFVLFFIEKTTAQDLETITKQKPVTVSGNLGISANTYYSNVFNPNNSPNGYAINGNVNISLYGLYNIPITIFMTNLSRGYGANPTPLTNLGFAPTYKRFTFYGGWSSVQFSQYTLAGAPFVGGGFEYKGKWLRLGAVGGNFQKAYGDTVALARPLGYQRTGYGVKLGFGNDGTFIDFTAFKAKEDSNSLPFRLKTHETRAKENLAVGTNFKTSFFKRRLSFDGELAVSAYNSDIGAQVIDLEEVAPQYSVIQKVFQPRFGTTFYYAGATSLGWQGRNFQSKLQYRRVSRDYRSLGALYVQGNLESYTLNTGWSMFRNKVRFSFTGGIQHDELPLFGSSVTIKDRLLMFATAGAYAKKLQVDLPVFTFRRIGSGSLSVNPVQWYGLDLSYSNFLTDQQVSSRLLLDTARTAQASQSFMVMNRFTFARSTMIHNIITVYNHSLFDNNAAIISVYRPQLAQIRLEI